jgi:hypothetical protein
MNNKYLIIICISILLVLIVIFHKSLTFWLEELWYFLFFRFENRWEPFIDQNQLETPDQTPVKICFITLETRGEKEDYVKLHNQSFREYVEYQNRKHVNHYAYEFITECDSNVKHTHNVYWCKFFSLHRLLEQGEYDYVVWVDSDTVIANYNVDFAQVLKSYQSDFFASVDDRLMDKMYSNLCSGVVAIRYSENGRKILQTMLDIYNQKQFQSKCISKTGDLNGAWSQTCYEQGVMNWVLYKYFRKSLTVLPNKYIRNGKKCEGDFIIHLFGSSSEKRKNCFNLTLQNVVRV